MDTWVWFQVAIDILPHMKAGTVVVRSEHGRSAQSVDEQEAAVWGHTQPQLLPNDPGGEDEMVPLISNPGSKWFPNIQSRVEIVPQYQIQG